ncbi:MAG: rhodanese-like domain-containing protein [bacterium]
MRQTFVVAFVLSLSTACGHSIERGGKAPVADGDWVVTAAQALADAEAGALLLDARSADQHAAGHVAGAVRVDWQSFSAPGETERGELHPDEARLQAALVALGVRRGVAVRVIGDPVAGWGEDGRIVWTLRTLGHEHAALVDGGHSALVRAGATVTTAASAPPVGDFAVARTDAHAITTAALRALVDSRGRAVIVDAREPREYAGETPYGEARGGHLPGAISLHYRVLLAADGRLLPREELRARLAAVGVTADRPVVVYCTGGVRSGWFVVVLRALGFEDARNYAGSMWQWAAGPAADYPLEIE